MMMLRPSSITQCCPLENKFEAPQVIISEAYTPPLALLSHWERVYPVSVQRLSEYVAAGTQQYAPFE